MTSDSFYGLLDAASARPAAFSEYTARELWTDEHTSSQMLTYHLNEDVDVSSRRKDVIDQSVHWMTNRFELSANSRIVDFGCGPGLYTSRFARTGAAVVGVDFSGRSIDYARKFAGANNLGIDYVEADYLEYQPEGEFDLITMIMCDFCALSPAQRSSMLAKFRALLADDGHLVLDVYSLTAFDAKSEESTYEKNQLNGFWSADPYYALVSTYKYNDEKVSLDKYTIVEENRQREVFNWLQYFTPQSLELEANAAGLSVAETYADVTGNAYDALLAEFAVVMTKTDLP